MGDLALPYVMPRIRSPELEFVKYCNALMAFRARRRRDVRLSHLPVDLTIDMTTTCQLSCPHCATGLGITGRPKLVMKRPDYDQILKGAGDPCFIIWYFSNGEPLLNRRFSPLVASSRHQAIFSVISTNLSFTMTDAAIRALLECGLGLIVVSLDGATAETYAQYRRGGAFNLVVDNMARLIEAKAKLGLTYPLIEWRFLRFQHNEREESEVRAMAERLGVDLLEFWNAGAPKAGSVNNRGVFAATLPLSGPPLSGKALAGLMRRQARERRLARLVPKLTVGGEVERADVTPKCDWLYYSGMFYPDGKLGPCCLVSKESTDFVQDLSAYPQVADAFNSDRHLASRAMFVTGEKGGTVCDACPTPSAQYYQFRMKLRAILRNAPDWAVKVMAAEPDTFFYPEDQVLAPEVEALFAGRGLGWLGGDAAILKRLRASEDPDVQGFARLLAA
ncbi:radical SAM/SPASM domain-containing protein [Caulobacter sp. S45]|uniref:radical SAM/SPASM domain-containing protein n=1 Tax=Caulobacter sp. S45 TaxID=1641861 RepID=UPI001576C208|nr:radical SAM/SPASM domain-containing protein [Caulobacter sp. S45]